MKNFLKTAVVVAGVAAVSFSAQASSFVVKAFENSSTGGTGKLTGWLTSGNAFSVSVNPGDLWNAGDLPRWSNADGLAGNLLATGTDDSAQPLNTLIGINFGGYTQGNLTAPYGTLVGQIGAGNFFVVGTSFSGIAGSSGPFKLYYWDSFAGDNSEQITANVVGLPDGGSTCALLGMGLMGVGFLRRKLQGV